ncbi:hypothetical protein [Methyloversatilis sp.]|uniref:hypothetical protein n=1 Tax=Methyloversatilis sp. TaxID=2569862 RepID=UPI003F703D29
MDQGKSKHAANPALDERISRMFGRDRATALFALVGLWLALGYVYLAVPHGFFGSPVGLVLTVAGVLVLLFNTASVVAMLRHYDEDRAHIYGIDIHHLDEHRARARKAALRPAHVDIG